MAGGEMSAIHPWQRVQWERIEAARKGDRLPHALLLTGVRGVGKRHFAGALARAHLCRYRNSEGFACGDCHSCLQYQAGTHPDFLLVHPEKEGKAITVDNTRRVTEFLTLKSHHGAGRVVLLEPAEAMNPAAANSLLKTLEEPPPGSLLILVTSVPGSLLATIRSRCQQMVITAERGIAERWLRQQAAGENWELLLRLAGDAPLRALQLREAGLLTKRMQLLEALERIAHGRSDPVSAVPRLLEQEQAAEILFWLDSWLTDMNRLKQVSRPPRLVNLDVEERLRQLAARCDGRQLFAFHERVMRAAGQLDQPLNPQLLLEELFIAWAHLTRAHDD